MKKPWVWGGILGGLAVVGSLYNAAKLNANPTNLIDVNIALFAQYGLTLALGIFLVVLSFNAKQKEDANPETARPLLDSPEDKKILENQRRWILIIFFCIEIAGSVTVWILNNYGAGLTALNLAVIADVIFNVVFVYFIFALLRNRSNILTPFFYVIVAYGVVQAILAALSEHWFSAVISILFSFYFAFVIKAPVNRRNHRIAHFIILPLYLAVSVCVPFFDNGKIIELTKKETLLEQQFLNDSSIATASYGTYLQRDVPNKQEMLDIKNGLAEREKKVSEIFQNLDSLESEYKKQTPSVSQKETIESFRFTKEILKLHQEQGTKLKELMDYSMTIDFTNLSQVQLENISALKKEIEDFQNLLTEVSHELENANLVY